MLLCKNRRLFTVAGDNSHVITPIPMHLIPIPVPFPSHGWSYTHSHRNLMGPMGSQSSPFPCTPLLTMSLGSRVVSVLDSGAVGPGFKSQPRRCRVTALGKLFTPIVPLFTMQWKLGSSPLKGCEGNYNYINYQLSLHNVLSILLWFWKKLTANKCRTKLKRCWKFRKTYCLLSLSVTWRTETTAINVGKNVDRVAVWSGKQCCVDEPG